MIHVLFSSVDHESTDIIGVFASVDDARFWRDWCNKHRHALVGCEANEAKAIWLRQGFPVRQGTNGYTVPSGDSYYFETWAVRPASSAPTLRL